MPDTRKEVVYPVDPDSRQCHTDPDVAHLQPPIVTRKVTTVELERKQQMDKLEKAARVNL